EWNFSENKRAKGGQAGYGRGARTQHGKSDRKNCKMTRQEASASTLLKSNENKTAPCICRISEPSSLAQRIPGCDNSTKTGIRQTFRWSLEAEFAGRNE